MATELLHPWVRLCLNDGVGYAQAKTILCEVFVHEARQELLRRGARVTVTALSLLSGMNQVAVRKALAADPERQLGRPSPVEQIMLEWTRGDWPSTLIYKGGDRSFTALVHSLDLSMLSPRILLREMKDRGLVSETKKHITLLNDVGSRNISDPAVRSHLIGAVADHAKTGIDNLYKTGNRRLEQSLICDGLKQTSIDEVHALAVAWWVKGSKDFYEELRRLDAADASCPPDEHHRMRLGVYFYSEPIRPAGSFELPNTQRLSAAPMHQAKASSVVRGR